MTAIAPNNANPELAALLARVKAQVGQCGLSEVILVDDKLVAGLTHTQWIRAVSKLQAEDAATYARLRSLYQEAGQADVEELPNEEIEEVAVDLVKAAESAGAAAAISETRYMEPALDNLVEILREVGLVPSVHTRVTDDVPHRNGKLYFLDYRMDDNEATAGKHAASLLKELVGRDGDDPPSAVLMSRGVNEHPTKSDWEKVASDAGYYRFNFRYLDKVKVEKGKMAFLFFLHDLLESYPLGKQYYSQLATVRDAARDAANAAFARIRQLSPSEFSIFAGKHLEDSSGRRASRHMLELFLGLLDAEVKDDEGLEASFRDFAKMLKTASMPASKDKETHALHQLHCRLLYDRSKWVLSGPVVFGDMYRKIGDPDVYYIVLTPECDLELRYVKQTDRWLPKVDEILMLRGEVTLAMPDKKDYLIIHPFVSETGQKWISWSLRQRVIAKSTDLVFQKPQHAAGWYLADDNGFTCYGYGADPNRYIKWGRLRNTEAEHIQQQFASDLAAVGIDDISGNTHARDVELWDNRNAKAPKKTADLVIVETANLKDSKKPYLALGEGCELALCAELAEDKIVDFDVLVAMRKPSVRHDFTALCQKGQLYLVETIGEPLRLVRSRSAVKDGWKPPEPESDEPPDAQKAIRRKATGKGGPGPEKHKRAEAEAEPPTGDAEPPTRGDAQAE